SLPARTTPSGWATPATREGRAPVTRGGDPGGPAGTVSAQVPPGRAVVDQADRMAGTHVDPLRGMAPRSLRGSGRTGRPRLDRGCGRDSRRDPDHRQPGAPQSAFGRGPVASRVRTQSWSRPG